MGILPSQLPFTVGKPTIELKGSEGFHQVARLRGISAGVVDHERNPDL
jgi:hypothetical protein